jgi:hypothetical protein
MSKQKLPETHENPALVKRPLPAAKVAAFSFAFLATGIAFAAFYAFWAPRVGENLDCRVYFLVLLAWGLPCAAFLSGAMRGYAFVNQKHLGTTVVLGGPIASFLLIVALGIRFAHCSPSTFDLTVRPCELDGKTPIFRSGTIILDLDNVRRQEEIGKNGEANFKGIPEYLVKSEITVSARVDGYKQESERLKLSDHLLYLPLTRSELHPDSEAADLIKKLIASEAELVLSNSRDKAAAEQYGDLFAAEAWIADSGCHDCIWRGRQKIMARFRNLTRFVELHHTLSSEPSIRDDGSATAEAMTDVLMENGPNNNLNGSGKEQWTFVKEGEKWKIRSFRYNMPQR